MMKKHLYRWLILPVTILFGSCLSGGNPNSAEVIEQVVNSCYEVVVPRLESDQIVYEKELPWDRIPFQIREDNYLSIGTAFAIGRNEFITAGHVLSFQDDSLFYKDYYLRDSSGETYPLDEILTFDDHRDFAIFSVEGYSAVSYLEFRDKPYEKNEPVYQVGNIYGQGLVAVPGTVLGDLPESQDGAWKNIKSSPPNDSGSSGGPLLDADLNVIGLITMKDDNFSYSLPAGVIRSVEENTGYSSIHSRFGFDLLVGEQTEAREMELTFTLPMELKDIKEEIRLNYLSKYQGNMEDLFESAGGLFPEGKGSSSALMDARMSSSIQILYRNNDDKRWYFSSLDKKSASLGNGGNIHYANVGDTVYFDLMMADNMTHEELYSSSKTVMDTILSGVSSTRNLAGQDIRILSFGEPFRSEKITDRYNRLWNMDYWALEYTDSVCILMWIPVPSGAVGMIRFVTSSDVEYWKYDLSQYANLVTVPYSTDLENWKSYLAHPVSGNSPYAGMALDYTEGESLSIDSSDFNLQLNQELFKVTDDTMLSLLRDFYPNEEGETIWGIRKINLSERDRYNYFVSFRYIKPELEDLDDSFIREWDSVIGEEHPYSGQSFQQEGQTNIGTLHSESPSGKVIQSVYIGREGNLDQAAMEEKLQVLQEGLTFKF